MTLITEQSSFACEHQQGSWVRVGEIKTSEGFCGDVLPIEKELPPIAHATFTFV